jgi:hypothetical protein
LVEAQALMVDARADDYLVLDTLASCQAATGDFEGAVERLRDIIARLRMEGLQRNAVAYFEDKLARFERREAIIEDSRSAGPLARQRIRPEAQRALGNDRQTSTDPSS